MFLLRLVLTLVIFTKHNFNGIMHSNETPSKHENIIQLAYSVIQYYIVNKGCLLEMFV